MKKIIGIFLAVMMLFSLASCGNSGNTAGGSERDLQASQMDSSLPEITLKPEAGEESGSPGENGSGILVAYFSWADNAVQAAGADAVTSPSVTAPGNVQELAGWIQEETGGDLFSIRVKEPYSRDWDECLERADEERREDARPALETKIADPDRYDTVFLGYPNWWYGVPMALLTFLEENDLSGKQVYLFCSHGTGGLARSVEIIEEAVPGAEISENIFDCNEEDAHSSGADIQAWIRELGF